MRIFAEEKIKEVLEQTLEGVEEDFIVVELEQPDARGHRSTACGIDLVPDLAKTNPTTPIIMLGWQTEQMFAKYPRWKEATSFKNVILRRLPVLKGDIISAITEVNVRLNKGQNKKGESPMQKDDKYSRDSRDSDDPIFEYDDEDLEGSRFDPDCEDDPM